jgi:hypothetical protein
MPEAMMYWPLNDPDSKATSQRELGQKELAKRAQKHQANWKYFEGDHRKHLKDDSTGTRDNVILNVIGLALEKEVAGLVGITDQGTIQGIGFEIVNEPVDPGFVARLRASINGRPQEGQADPAQDYLDAVWRANKKDLLLVDALLDGAICGHSFLKLIPDAAQDPFSADPLPRILALNPSNISVFWSDEDREVVLFYRIQASKTHIQDVVHGDYYADGYPGWVIVDYTRETDMGRWAVSEVSAWEHPWPPLVDWPNLPPARKDYYGRDSLGTNGGLNDALNFVASNTQRILKHHAHPKTVGLGINASDLEETAVDGFWTVGESKQDADIYNLEMQSDLQSSIGFMGLMRRAVFDQARELDPGSVQDKLGEISNFGLRVLYNDNLAKGGLRRMTATEALERLNRHLLELGKFPHNVPVAVLWPDPLPTDPLVEAQALQIDKGFGLSDQTALEVRGYNPEQEKLRGGTAAEETPPPTDVQENQEMRSTRNG